MWLLASLIDWTADENEKCLPPKRQFWTADFTPHWLYALIWKIDAARKLAYLSSLRKEAQGVGKGGRRERVRKVNERGDIIARFYGRKPGEDSSVDLVYAHLLSLSYALVDVDWAAALAWATKSLMYDSADV